MLDAQRHAIRIADGCIHSRFYPVKIRRMNPAHKVKEIAVKPAYPIIRQLFIDAIRIYGLDYKSLYLKSGRNILAGI